MAEFQDVIKHWGRMLDAHRHGESIAIEASVPADAFKDAKLVEKIVMSWAAEHPEPVYPSIAKYLEQFGIIIRRDGSLEADFFKAHEPMNAEMAKLLGIEPKEGA